jgi:organic hydroperoxide reductase OsmC/OhrA
MSTHSVELFWEHDGGDFLSGHYSRRHRIRFDGGVEIAGSASPHVVPLPWSDASAVDPEEAFVAAIASCHMLWFLSLAAGQGYAVQRYVDAPCGVMALNAEGRRAITRVTLRPEVRFLGSPVPTPTQIDMLHEQAHRQCFIANSVRTEIVVEPAP